MPNKESDSEKQGTSSNKKLVRTLIIIGIGIPVLVELLTLFNLINVQLIGDEQKEMVAPEPVTETRTFTEGDTLYADYPSSFVIEQMRIKVTTSEWRFEMSLFANDAGTKEKQIVTIDSLRLKSGKVLQGKEAMSEGVGQGISLSFKRVLPMGDIPQILYISSVQRFSPDSVKKIPSKARLGNIPIRYERE